MELDIKVKCYAMLGLALLALVSRSQPLTFMCVQVPENIHTHPMVGHWKFRGGWGGGGTKESMKLSHNFQRGGGFKVKKNHPWGINGYFLEPHNEPA